MKKYIIALDRGTTSCRAIIFDENGEAVSLAQRELGQIFPKEGWVEQDAEDIFSLQYLVMKEALEKAGLTAKDAAAIGISNQRETTLLWDRDSGKPLYNAIVWQCRRTRDICLDLEKRGMADYIKKTTGLIIDPYFSATKIKWLFDNVPGIRARAKEGKVMFGTVDTWLLYRLTGGKVHATDYTNASRTMLFDIHSLSWDERLLKELDIPRDILPRVFPSRHDFGYAEIDGEKVPITGIAGDQQAALFGQRCFEKGQAKNTYGTGCFLLMNTGDTAFDSKRGLLTTIAAGAEAEKVSYALEGSVFTGGSVIQWLRDGMRFFSDSPDAEYFASKVADTGGVYVVPAFTGLGAPRWNMYARGSIFGITRGTKREHIIRACQESIAYQVSDLVSAMEEDTGIRTESLRVDGGAARDAFLMQFQADILSRPVERPENRETTALGACLLAGLGAGLWRIEDLKEEKGKDVFKPLMPAEKAKELIKGWHRALDACVYHADLGKDF